jgi:endogenous inhibitor of DNA gyrase (YacG/DUF329 family)
MSQLRDCVTCGAQFIVPARNPHKRFCSPRCRVADWHARNDRARDIPNAVPHDVPDQNAVPNPNAAPANNAQRCPHCHQPLAVIVIVVPPTAAHVRTPEPAHA